MGKKTGRVPKPRITAEECAICELDWDYHPDNPSILDCVALLQDELRRERTRPWYPWMWVTCHTCNTTPCMCGIDSTFYLTGTGNTSSVVYATN